MVRADAPYAPKIKIFSDGADRAGMLELAKNPLITGMTTNPSLMKKAGVTEYRSFCKDLLTQIADKPISFEVFADDLNEMRRQANEIATWGKNVYVKIPVTNCEGVSTLPLVKELALGGTKINVTAILTLAQVEATAQALKGGAPSVVSVFAGRIADTGRDPMPIMSASVQICQSADKNIELLWASTREVLNLMQAELAGCHIITVPFDILKKLSGIGTNLNELSLETVRMFKRDADSAGFTL